MEYKYDVAAGDALATISAEISARRVVLSVARERKRTIPPPATTATPLPIVRGSFEIAEPLPSASDWALVATAVATAAARSFSFGGVRLDTSAAGLEARCGGLSVSFPPAVAWALRFVASVSDRSASLGADASQMPACSKKQCELKYGDADTQVCVRVREEFAELRVSSPKMTVCCEIGNFGATRHTKCAAENVRNIDAWRAVMRGEDQAKITWFAPANLLVTRPSHDSLDTQYSYLRNAGSDKIELYWRDGFVLVGETAGVVRLPVGVAQALEFYIDHLPGGALA